MPLAVRLIALIALALATGCGAEDSGSAGGSATAGLRVVSVNPSLTAILLALDAADLLVGVDEFSALQQPAVAALPRVGGLFNPSLEAVVALEPDLVVLVPSIEQRDFAGRLREIGLQVVVFENIRFEQVLENIERLGRLVGREAQAARRIAEIRGVRASAERLTAGRESPRTVVVLQRDPVFVVGRGSFIDELLAATGAENLGAQFDEPYPQVAVEWLVDAAPEVLIDMSDEPGDPLEYWSRWPAIPAVAGRRVLHLAPFVTLPGPDLDRSIRVLVESLHGPDLAARL
jgi:iron complex transport system substrate-binding protein